MKETVNSVFDAKVLLYFRIFSYTKQEHYYWEPFVNVTQSEVNNINFYLYFYFQVSFRIFCVILVVGLDYLNTLCLRYYEKVSPYDCPKENFLQSYL